MSQLSPQQEEALKHAIQVEEAKANLQALLVDFTDNCFPKCISKPGGKLSDSEKACFQNCVARFHDVSAFIAKRIVEKAQKSHELAS